MKGVILAAGLGTRLRPLTCFRAKPAVPFLNKPLIQYSLELLRQIQVEEVVINLHHLPETVVEAVGEKGSFSYEEQILGTAGALGKVREILAGSTIIVSNGKIYFEEDLSRAVEFHRESGARVTLVLVPFSEGDPFNPVLVDDDSNIIAFFGRNHPSRDRKGAAKPYIFTGIHILSPQVLDFIPEGPSDTVTDLYPKLMQAGHKIKGFVSQAYWAECSTPRRYLEKSLEVLRRRDLENLLESEIEAECRSVIAGSSVEVGRGTVLENCIFWDRVEVGAGCSLKNVILTSDVRLPAGVRLDGALITPDLDNPGDYKIWADESH
ncbi:MAG: sugar phosphate nucleotidyltransferase [Acidobacteriota bacterium]